VSFPGRWCQVCVAPGCPVARVTYELRWEPEDEYARCPVCGHELEAREWVGEV
jgi:hypothetical protein